MAGTGHYQWHATAPPTSDLLEKKAPDRAELLAVCSAPTPGQRNDLLPSARKGHSLAVIRKHLKTCLFKLHLNVYT